jgi:protein YIPF5/7
MQRHDNSDAFFNSFGQNSPARNRGPPPPGPPPQPAGRGPPPPGPPPFRPPQRAQPPSNSYVLSSSSSSSQQPAGQPTSYYAPPRQQQHQPPQQPYGNQQQQQQSNDWYNPSTSGNFPGAGMMQQPQQQQPMMAAVAPVYNNAYLEGTMDTSGRSMDPVRGMMQPQTFIPQQQPHDVTGQADLNDYYGEEPPLLEELGVNVEHILMKTKAVVIPFRRFQKQSALADPSIIVEDADLAGPLAFALLLGGELLITGKLQFGYIYGFGLFGCLAMTAILNLMSPTAISFWTVTSILGYALLPVNILAALKIVLFSFGTLTRLLAVVTVLWSTTASTRMLEIGFGLADQRYLLAYPIALLYSAFVLITIF